MSTRFYQAVHNNASIKPTAFYDTEAPEEFFRVIAATDRNC